MINCLIKIIHYKLVKVTIDARKLTEVVIDILMQYYALPDLIISKRGAIFTSKF